MDKIKSSWPYTLAVIIIAFISLGIKTLPADTVFLSNGFVKFVSDDSWYHMRLLEFLLQNYPHGLYFEPWTHYPYGTYNHYGPLFEQLMAIPVLILGRGNPSSELVNIIGAYFPAVLGALTVIPVYYIGKYLGSRKSGLIAAILIALAPGQFLARSMIGFTDNHVAEALFSTLFIMFFMLALISAKRNELRFEHIFNKDFDVLKKPLMYAIMAGIMYSAYQLSWIGASLFAFITVTYSVFQYFLNNLRKESSDYLGIVGIITFLVSAVLLLPSVHPEIGLDMYAYSWFTVVVAMGTLISFVVLSFIERAFIKKRLNSYYYPLAILGLSILGLITINIISPSFYSTIINAPKAIFGVNTGGAATIAEASSIFYMGGVFSWSGVFGNFTAQGFIVSILGILLLMVSISRKSKPEEVLVIVWSVLIFFAIYSQNRFAYYYSVNVSVLCGYVGGLLLEKVKWNELNEKFQNNVKSSADLPNALKFIKVQQVLAVLAIIVFLIYPAYGAAIQQATGSNDPPDAWIEACTWLRSNTPDPGMDYNGIYDAPKNGETFQYPDTAYGVMSWWDYGDYIEIFGHRIPDANPFQEGIGGRRGSINETNEPGAATFFTAQSEKEATSVLKAIDPRPGKMGARYIMSDARMATDIFAAMPAWTLDNDGYYQAYLTGNGYQEIPSTRYFNSMEARLHIFDGNGLKQYRMVYETEAYQTAETVYKQVYDYVFGGNISAVDTGYVKIFEYVKGANITGTASPNETVNINTTIRTNQGRTFAYSQSTTADSQGRYEFTVPYSTEGPISGQTQFETAPTGPYVLSYDNTTKDVRVSEKAVLNGEEIKV
jgi:dolichyl-diphosphooligosaccharide--protein glycosyltransferase